MSALLGVVYGVFLAVDVRLMGYVLAASVLMAVATVLGMRRLMRVHQMVVPGIVTFFLNLLILWFIFEVFLGYPLFRIQSIFELP